MPTGASCSGLTSSGRAYTERGSQRTASSRKFRRLRVCFYRLELDGTCTTVLRGLTISNGIGWSPDGGAALRCFSSQGSLLAAVPLPVDRPTSCRGTSLNDGPAPVRTLARATRLIRDAKSWERLGLYGASPQVDITAALASARRVADYVHDQHRLADARRRRGIDLVDRAVPRRSSARTRFKCRSVATSRSATIFVAACRTCSLPEPSTGSACSSRAPAWRDGSPPKPSFGKWGLLPAHPPGANCRRPTHLRRAHDRPSSVRDEHAWTGTKPARGHDWPRSRCTRW